MIVVAVLVALRLIPAAMTLPVLGGPLAPWSARLALTAMAAAALALVQPPDVVTAVTGLPLAGLIAIAMKELAIGAVLALIVAVPFVAADTAGRWIGAGAGGLGAGGIGPTGPTSTTGLVTSLLAVVVFVGIGGHLVVIAALAGSYDALPLLGGLDRAVAAQHAATAATAMFGAAVALAAPALVASALVELALGLIQRASGGAVPIGGGGLRAAAVIAFFAAGLLLLSIALARGLGDAARTMEAAIPGLS